jgi:pimeloyl-ACP methyl ester carboxylesterase
MSTSPQATQMSVTTATAVHYRTVQIDGIDIFYREAGRPDAPTILLLHGFPSSSQMFHDLIPLLADRYHLVAPDYPGFGYSAMPAIADFAYTFDHLADVMDRFTDAVHLTKYSLYMQDFGGPVGLRLAARHPERVSALLVQNANAYIEGVTPELVAILLRLHRERTPEMRETAAALFELPYTKRQYLEGVGDPSLVNPDSWQLAQLGMDRPGNKEIQYAYHADYATNFDHYDEWHAYFRKSQPPTLVVWGRGDFVFGVPGAEAYRKDLQDIDVHIIDAGHFALETRSSEIAGYIRQFLAAHGI